MIWSDMDKYIRVGDIRNALIELAESGKWLGRKTTTNIIKALRNLPTIDIVRCEECLWQDDCSRMVKSMDGLVSTALTWCSDGERKDNG